MAGRERKLSHFDGRFIDKHDWDVILDSVDTVALGALQALRILAVFERLLVGGAHQNLQQIFGNHDQTIVRPKIGNADKIPVLRFAALRSPTTV
jgi:hypothetical protein